jgi:hypothetical protein
MIADLSLTNVKIFCRLLFCLYVVLRYVTGVKKTKIEFLGMLPYKRIIDLCYFVILTDLIPVVCALKKSDYSKLYNLKCAFAPLSTFN